jgi:hypothetical protein
MKYFLGLEDIGELGEWRTVNNKLFYKKLVQRFQAGAHEIGMNSSISNHKMDSGLMEIPSYSICLFSNKYS